MLERTGLDLCFERLFISSETGFVKPDPRAVEDVLATLSLDPARVIFVDDKERNLQSARQLGVETLLSDGGSEWVARISKP